MKLLIAVPTLDFIHTEFVKSLTALILRLKDDGVDFDVHIESGTLVYAARERIAVKAIEEKYTHILWLDSDMVFDTNILDDLLFCGKPFVTGIYHARRKGYGSCIFSKTEDENGSPYYETFEEYPSTVFEIAGCGFGCVLTETSVLEDVRKQKGVCFTPMPDCGEDIAFCKRAREIGYKIFCDPTIVCGHIGHIAIYPEDHERWKETIRNYDEVSKCRK